MFFNKLGFTSLAILALSYAIPHVQAKSAGEQVPQLAKVKDEASPLSDLLFLSIQQIDNLYYIVMVKPVHSKGLTKAESDHEEFKVSLRTSRKEVKEENIKKMMAAPLPYCCDFPQD